MNIKPIKSTEDLQRALAEIDNLWEAKLDTPEGDALDVLITLVETYEAKHCPISPPEPVEAIKFSMDQRGLTNNDLVASLGQSSRVSEILNKKRKLSLAMIRKLHVNLSIPLESLVSDYQLAWEKPGVKFS
jgi:HTH-type transcriptional regulator/antitoxin HigA